MNKSAASRVKLTLCLVSGITYVLVYRTDKYKKLTAEVEKDSKKCKLKNCIVEKLCNYRYFVADSELHNSFISGIAIICWQHDN